MTSEVLSTETKFTPGPWSVLTDHPQNACAYIKADDGDEIAILYGGDECEKDSDGVWGPQPIRDATASLMAAAPDLYEALQFIYERIADPERSPRDLYPALGLDAMRAIDMASAALARARGGSSNEGE